MPLRNLEAGIRCQQDIINQQRQVVKRLADHLSEGALPATTFGLDSTLKQTKSQPPIASYQGPEKRREQIQRHKGRGKKKLIDVKEYSRTRQNNIMLKARYEKRKDTTEAADV